MAESLRRRRRQVDPNERAGKGDAASVRCGDELVADREPAERVAAVAGALAEMGVRSEERVLIILPDGPGFVGAFLGVMHRGAVPLPVNPLLPADDISMLAAAAGGRAGRDLGCRPAAALTGRSAASGASRRGQRRSVAVPTGEPPSGRSGRAAV